MPNGGSAANLLARGKKKAKKKPLRKKAVRKKEAVEKTTRKKPVRLRVTIEYNLEGTLDELMCETELRDLLDDGAIVRDVEVI